MSEVKVKEGFPETNFTKRLSDTKSLRNNRRLSKLPKCTSLKSNFVNQKLEHTEGNSQSLDFSTRMILKEKISELQQINNELKFKLTTAEGKLKAKDSELVAAEALNKQIKHLLDKHITREQELNYQIINLEKKNTKVNNQLSELEEEKTQFLTEKSEFVNSSRTIEELKGNVRVKESQILDLSGQLAEIKQSLHGSSTKNKILESQLEEVRKVEPMLDIRKNYINTLEVKIRNLEKLYAHANEENGKLKNGIDRLENFRFHSFLASMGKTTNLLQSPY